jgi:hypothetical protein
MPVCTLQTLMDPDRRATYDALAGFSASSINPFADVSMPADQVGSDDTASSSSRGGEQQDCTGTKPTWLLISWVLEGGANPCTTLRTHCRGHSAFSSSTGGR